jgi:hypothetical protein
MPPTLSRWCPAMIVLLACATSSCGGHPPKVAGKYSVSASILGATKFPLTLRSGGTGTTKTRAKVTWTRSGSRVVIVATALAEGAPMTTTFTGQINSSGLSSRSSPGSMLLNDKKVPFTWYAVRSN